MGRITTRSVAPARSPGTVTGANPFILTTTAEPTGTFAHALASTTVGGSSLPVLVASRLHLATAAPPHRPHTHAPAEHSPPQRIQATPSSARRSCFSVSHSSQLVRAKPQRPFCAASIAAPTRSIVSSSKCRPRICTPIGSPAAVSPARHAHPADARQADAATE